MVSTVTISASAVVIVLIIPATTSRRRRRWHYMRDSCFIHLFIECRQILVDCLFHLRGSFGNQWRQFGQLFFLLGARGGGKVVQVFHQVLYLGGKRLGLPFERRPGIAEALLLALVLQGTWSTFFCSSSALFTMASGIFVPLGF